MRATCSFLAVLLSVLLALDVASGACPKIITRSEWNARPAKSFQILKEKPAPYVVIHHSATQSCTKTEDCKKLVKSFQNHHMDVNGWEDIGYTFVVGQDGNVYEGRGWGKVGAHAPNYNSRSVGICVIGDFTSVVPNAAAIKAVQDLIECAVSKNEIDKNYKLIGHKQVRDTECPGTKFYELIKKWPNWTANPQ